MPTPDLAGRRVLVTGASGFIGRRLTAALTQAGAEAHATGRRAEPPDSLAARWWPADLGDPEAARRLLADVRPELVFHLASAVTGSRDLAAVLPTFTANLAATVHLLAAAAAGDRPRIVLAGSLEEPGPEAPVPASPYAAAKGAALAYGRMFHALYAMPVVHARLFMVYGPGQADRAKLVPYVIGSLLRGESPRLSSAARAVDWVYVDDVVHGLLLAGTRPGLAGESVDIGTGSLVSVREVAERLGRLIDPGLAIAFGALPDRPLERVRVADVAATRRQLGWVPETTLEDGLARTTEWLRALA